MRVATQEEDVILQKISTLQSGIFNTENEIMLCESQIKGYKEKRRQLTTKFFTVVIILAFILLISFGYLVHLKSDSQLTVALFLGSGGLGLFAIAYLIYSIVFFVRYFAQTSRSNFWLGISEKMQLDNVDSLELANKTRLSQFRSELKDYREQLEERMKTYLDLKDKNDKIFEEELKSGKRKADFNFDAFDSYTEVNNDYIKFNKLRVDLNKLRNKKQNEEEEIDKMVINEANCHKSIRLFFISMILLIGSTCGLFVMALFSGSNYELWMIHLGIIIFIIISGMAVITCAVNFIVKLPYISESGIAKMVADKLGLEYTKADLEILKDNIYKDDAEIIRIKDEIEAYKEKFKNESDEV